MSTISTSSSPFLQRALQSVQSWDRSRDSFAGEHWVTLAAGLALLRAASRSNAPAKRLVQAALGGALLFRAASGRDGVARLLQQLPSSRGLLH